MADVTIDKIFAHLCRKPLWLMMFTMTALTSLKWFTKEIGTATTTARLNIAKLGELFSYY